jgi:two-component system chemotaxis response regulator CheB
LIDQGELEVVGEAATGEEAVHLVSALAPDVIVMEVSLPGLDGIAVTERLSETHDVPIVLVTSEVDRERLVSAFRTVRRGVVGVYAKPTVPDQWHEFGVTLNETLVGVTRPKGWTAPERGHPPATGRAPIRFVVVGSSTGGPAALAEMLQEIESPYPASVLIVQHIAVGFDDPLASWLASETGLDVRVAEHGELIGRGQVRMAPADAHLVLEPAGRLRIDGQTEPRNGHRPSADLLFESLADMRALRTAAVLLSGMGSDGVEGMARLREAGAVTAVQDEASSVVWGMPRVARERGVADLVLSPAAIGRWLNAAFREPFR